MDILEHIEEVERKKRAQQESSPTPGQPASAGKPMEVSLPVSGDTNTPPSAPAPNNYNERIQVKAPKIDIPGKEIPAEAMVVPHDNTPKWAKMSYEELVKINPNWSRGQYAYELAKLRRENGQPDMSYTEWANIIKGHDPYETEAERQKRERNMNIANSVNAVGSFINALVNYNRVKRGHVGYTPDDGSQGYDRLQRLREAQRQTARVNANAYLDAMDKDRAERMKTEIQKSAEQQAQRNYEMKQAELQFRIDNAKTERERKAAEAEQKKLEFEWKKGVEEKKMKETARHNRAMESKTGEESGKVVTSVKSSDGRIMTRNAKLSEEEARQLVMSRPDWMSIANSHRKISTTLEDGVQTTRTGDIDWHSAAADVLSNGNVEVKVLEDMGFKPSQVDKGKSKGPGWGVKKNDSNTIGW